MKTMVLKLGVVLWILLRLLGTAMTPGLRAEAAGGPLRVGAARVDVTPREPIRLTGYASRQSDATNAAQPLWAKALAIDQAGRGVSVMVTVDHCGVPANITEEVAKRLGASLGLARERFAVCSTHTHAGPVANGFAPNIFAKDITPEQQSAIDRYTVRLTDEIEKAARQAIASLRPGSLRWGQGQAGFGANRRTAGGPVDHSVNVLEARDAEGKPVGIVANYACHCTTIGGDFNRHCGDWAGFAQEAIERDYPGCVGLVSIGCGADTNPSPRGGADFGYALAKAHGQSLADETRRVLGASMKPLHSAPSGQFRHVQLPYQKHFTPAEWESRSRQPGIVGYHARKYLARIQGGLVLPHSLKYPIQTWVFGEDLAMVFLGGEVVVDYAVDLKDIFDHRRLWINAYANDVPCYIPSRRILAEGGYEAEESLWYYDRPARLAPATESLIVNAVQAMLPPVFQNANPTNALPPPRDVPASLESFTLDPGLEIECVASEPLIVDPVAIDFGPDGRLWVLEMRDYPSGMDGKGSPGGRIRVLRDLDGDGRFDTGETFLDRLPYPTGLMVWNGGVIVGAAPDVLFARDLDDDGKAEQVEKWFTGFATHNFQARVNGFALGLDGWLHGSSGLFGGSITNLLDPNHPVVECRGRDFRWDPRTGVLLPDAGVSQQGRVRDDFGRWFGNDNSTLLWHYPMPEPVLTRNPHASPGLDRISIAGSEELQHLNPSSRTLPRFNDAHHANRVTSACGPGLYRDTALGANYAGNAFVCEPVHNLVRRLVLHPDGATFKASRAPGETNREFLSSSDHGFRPVQVRTGPDGCLWVVDMYRQVIEHPRWITPDRLARVDVRAGEDRGRVYRIRSKQHPPNPARDLTRLRGAELAAALDSPNGTVRDLVQQRLMADPKSARVAAVLTRLAGASPHAAVRAQALSVLANTGELKAALLEAALRDPDPGVRGHAASLTGGRLATSGRFARRGVQWLSMLGTDSDASVRFLAAVALGGSTSAEAAQRLGELAVAHARDPWFRTALITANPAQAVSLLKHLLEQGAWGEVIEPLAATAVSVSNPAEHAAIARLLVSSHASAPEPWRLRAVAGFLEARSRRDLPLSGSMLRDLAPTFDHARRSALDSQLVEEDRLAALRLLRFDAQLESMPNAVAPLLQSGSSPAIQSAALDTLGFIKSPAAAGLLLDAWPGFTPGLRQRAAEQLLQRAVSTKAWLDRIESRVIPALEVGAAHRERLLKHGDPDIQSRARALFLNRATNSGSRAELVAKFVKSAAQTASGGASGGELFTQHCAPCHRFRGAGFAVGADLESLTDRSREALLTAILDPNAAIDDRYRGYEVETKDGRLFSGIVSSENAAHLTLTQSGGGTERLLRADIRRVSASGLSLMPEGFEHLMTPEELETLVRFLQAPPESEGAAKAQFLAAGSSPVLVIRSAERLPYRSWIGTMPLALCRLKPGQNALAWSSTPLPATVDGGFLRFRFAAAMGFITQPPGTFTLKVDGVEAATFDVTLSSASWNSPDGQVRVRYAVQQSSSEDSHGILTVDLAAGRLSAGRAARFEVVPQSMESQRWFGVYEVE